MIDIFLYYKGSIESWGQNSTKIFFGAHKLKKLKMTLQTGCILILLLVNLQSVCSNDIWGKQWKWIQLTKEVEIKGVEILYYKRITMKHVTRFGI
jgi:alcohol dehydrogenase YqhD (iron-dependent ADH family)